jgi:hypothetical protein
LCTSLYELPVGDPIAPVEGATMLVTAQLHIMYAILSLGRITNYDLHFGDLHVVRVTVIEIELS